MIDLRMVDRHIIHCPTIALATVTRLNLSTVSGLNIARSGDVCLSVAEDSKWIVSLEFQIIELYKYKWIMYQMNS